MLGLGLGLVNAIVYVNVYEHANVNVYMYMYIYNKFPRQNIKSEYQYQSFFTLCINANK